MEPRISLLKNAGLVQVFFCLFSLTVVGQTTDRPNILWLVSEDNSASNHGCYGNEQAITPNIDGLAEEGIIYDNAFANAPVCAPARFTIITGMYASACGTQHMRSNNAIPDEFRFFPEYLRRAGYYCTNNAKEDYNTRNAEYFGDNKDAYSAWDESSRTAHYKNRKPGQPFFAVFNTHLSSEKWIHYHLMEEEEQLIHNPADIELAPYHPDLPEVRNCYACCADHITMTDRWVGEMLKELDQKGLSENTIVIYYTDHGGSLPRSMRYLFESGTRIAMIVRFPEKYQHLAPTGPGTRETRLVSFVDLAPTILKLAGIEIPGHMQGLPFLGAQMPEAPEYAFCFRGRMDERYDMMRSVRDKKYRYIRNYMPHRIYGQHLWYLWRSPATRAWELAYENGLCNTIQSRFWEKKSTEELYDITRDPHNVHNLAGIPEYQDILEKMREENRKRVRKNRGAGFIPEGMMTQMAGNSTIYQLTHSEDFPVEEIIHAAEVASEQKPENLYELMNRLSADHPAVRYWAATGCLILGEEAIEASSHLRNMLEDPYGDNRIVAAEALCEMGFSEQSLEVLVAEMNNDNQWVQLHALNSLQCLGDRARPVTREIMSNARSKVRDMYFRWAYRDLIGELKPGWIDYEKPHF